jgi:hypothetical protein
VALKLIYVMFSSSWAGWCCAGGVEAERAESPPADWDLTTPFP